MKRKSKTRYGSLKDRIRKNSKKTAESFLSGTVRLPQGVEFWAPKAGSFVVDHIPYKVKTDKHPDGVEPGELWYKLPYYIHVGIGIDERSYVCPKTFGERCPICEYIIEQKKRKDVDRDVLKAITAKPRVLYNVRISRYSDLMVWDISYYNYQRQLDREINEVEDDSVLDFADVDGKHTIKARFATERIPGIKYVAIDRIDFISRKRGYSKEILDEALCLEELLVILPYKRLEQIFYEGEEFDVIDDEEDVGDYSDEDIEEDEDEVIDEDEEEEDESDSDEEDEDEEEERPVRSRGKRKERRTKAKSGKKCPYGHKFGADCDRYDECETCEKWEECLDAGEGNE